MVCSTSSRYAYIKGWYESVVTLGLRAVIFHDGLSREFTERLQTVNISFVLSTLEGRLER